MRRHVGRKRGVKYLDSFIEGAFLVSLIKEREREANGMRLISPRSREEM